MVEVEHHLIGKSFSVPCLDHWFKNPTSVIGLNFRSLINGVTLRIYYHEVVTNRVDTTKEAIFFRVDSSTNLITDLTQEDYRSLASAIKAYMIFMLVVLPVFTPRFSDSCADQTLPSLASTLVASNGSQRCVLQVLYLRRCPV
jgi:hypothetical protein